MCKNVNGGESPQSDELPVSADNWDALKGINQDNIGQLAKLIEPIRLDLEDGMDELSIIEDVRFVREVMVLEALSPLRFNFPYTLSFDMQVFFERLFTQAYGCPEKGIRKTITECLVDLCKFGDILLEMSEEGDHELGYTGRYFALLNLDALQDGFIDPKIVQEILVAILGEPINGDPIRSFHEAVLETAGYFRNVDIPIILTTSQIRFFVRELEMRFKFGPQVGLHYLY